MDMIKLLLQVLILATFQAKVSLSAYHTSPTSHFIFDENGRVVMFHGFNVVEKGFPWYPEVLKSDGKIEQIKSWGINTIRLGFMWSGAEPAENNFDMTYYNIVGDIVDSLSKHGISVLLDIHQDVQSSKFCLYDGAPTWLVEKSRVPEHAFPWPLKSGIANNPCPYDRAWGKNYLAEATGVAFDGLYHNYGGMRDAFENFLQFTGSYFKDKDILGYELINEPWAGDIYANPTLLTPGRAGSLNLQPFYDSASTALRKSDPNNLIFYEPVTWGMIFNGNITGSGLDHVPGGAEFSDKSVFSFHYYCWWLKDDTDLQRQTCDRLFGPKIFEQVSRETRRMGGAAMLTEWGQGCHFDTDSNDASSECVAIMDLADKHLMGWMDWYFQGELSHPTDNAIAIYARTYARRIAGRPVSMNFDAKSKDFKLCYVATLFGPSAQTEIFAHFELSYPEGVDVAVTDNLELVKVDVVNNLIQVKNKVKAPDSVECVTVSKKVA